MRHSNSMQFPESADISAIAQIAFQTTRYPECEEQIGRMMAESVPKKLRPGAAAYAGTNPAADLRARRMEITRSLSGTGATIADLHAALGVSYYTAQEYAHIVGGFERQKAAPSDEARPSPRRDEAARRWNEGQSVAQIARAMGTTGKNIRRHLRQAGVAL